MKAVAPRTEAETRIASVDPMAPCSPYLLPDGTHVFFMSGTSAPCLGIPDEWAGHVEWSPTDGLRIRIETTGNLTEGLKRFHQSLQASPPAGTIQAVSTEPELVGRIPNSESDIALFSLNLSSRSTTHHDDTDVRMRTAFEGTAHAATTRIRLSSSVSRLHETDLGVVRALLPGIQLHNWQTTAPVTWTVNGLEHFHYRCSCELLDIPRVQLFAAERLTPKLEAWWLVAELSLTKENDPEWAVPEPLVSARGLLSFLCGVRLPFLAVDKVVTDTEVKRTYLGRLKMPVTRSQYRGRQPVPLQSLEHAHEVVPYLASLFATYRRWRRWFDLDWIAGPLWYAHEAFLDDRLGLAVVALERFATATKAFLEAHPDEKRFKSRFLTRPQFRALRQTLEGAIQEFAKRTGNDLGQSSWPAVSQIVEQAIAAIDDLETGVLSEAQLVELRAEMLSQLREADLANKAGLAETKQSIIEKRIGSFGERTNQDKLAEAIEQSGVVLQDEDLDVIERRNDCLHGRRTLLDSTSHAEISAEISRFDRLRTLLSKALLARLRYSGVYVDYGVRPSVGEFPVKRLLDELRTE